MSGVLPVLGDEIRILHQRHELDPGRGLLRVQPLWHPEAHAPQELLPQSSGAFWPTIAARSFSARNLLREAAGIVKGSAMPNREAAVLAEKRVGFFRYAAVTYVSRSRKRNVKKEPACPNSRIRRTRALDHSGEDSATRSPR